jgi:DNA-binding MarR family transcriptional regulator
MDDESAIRLRRIIIKLARQLNTPSTGAGLTPSQASVLGIIVGSDRMSLSELAAYERLNPTMLSRVVGRLQELGFIERIPDPADLRSASVVSTAAGELVDQQIKARRAAALAQCLDLLTPDQVSALTDSLPALEALAEAMRLAAPDQARQAAGDSR